MVNNQYDNLTPSAIINSLSSSHTTHNNNNIITDEMIINSDSPIVSDDEEGVNCLTNSAAVPGRNLQAKQNMIKH
jgi:hypothetical protein